MNSLHPALEKLAQNGAHRALCAFRSRRISVPSGLLYVIGLCMVSAPVWAGENVVLTNGFRLHADRHEISGSLASIYSGDGVTEMPVSQIAGYEPDQTPPAAPPAQPPPAPSAVTAASGAVNPAELAAEAAKKYKLPDSFVRSVMKAESGFHTTAVSPKGAVGLMQLMPETARQLGVDPHDPRQNAEGGAAYLQELLARYENDPDQVLRALAAYNAGPAAVEQYHGVPPFRETREYILRVLKEWDQKGLNQTQPTAAGNTQAETFVDR